MECFRSKIDDILERKTVGDEIEDYIKNRLSEKWISKKCLFIHSGNGVGKTSFITQIVSNCGYNMIYYNSLDMNVNTLSDIKRIVTGSNIISSITKKNIVLVIDDLHFKTTDDKNITSLLYKLCSSKTSVKKTKTTKITQPRNQKQKQKECNEIVIRIPIICIGNFNDKKNREMGKICHLLNIDIPTNEQIHNIISLIMPDLPNIMYWVYYINGNLKILSNIYLLYSQRFFEDCINWDDVMANTNYSNNVKLNTQMILTKPISFTTHTHFINDGDKSITSLLFHENVIDYINNETVYLSILNNFCFADFIDRFCFKKQIWQLNELSFYIKTFKNNQILNEDESNIVKTDTLYSDLRFTKILTKYSTEYNNRVFFSKIINILNADKKDILSWAYKHNNLKTQIDTMIEKYPISKLDMNRLMKFINISISDTNEFPDDEQEDEFFQESQSTYDPSK